MLQNANSTDSSAPYTDFGFEGGQHDFDDGAQNMPDFFGGLFFGGPVGQETPPPGGFAGMDGVQFTDGSNGRDNHQEGTGWGGQAEG